MSVGRENHVCVYVSVLSVSLSLTVCVCVCLCVCMCVYVCVRVCPCVLCMSVLSFVNHMCVCECVELHNVNSGHHTPLDADRRQPISVLPMLQRTAEERYFAFQHLSGATHDQIIYNTVIVNTMRYILGNPVQCVRICM